MISDKIPAAVTVIWFLFSLCHFSFFLSVHFWVSVYTSCCIVCVLHRYERIIKKSSILIHWMWSSLAVWNLHIENSSKKKYFCSLGTATNDKALYILSILCVCWLDIFGHFNMLKATSGSVVYSMLFKHLTMKDFHLRPTLSNYLTNYE